MKFGNEGWWKAHSKLKFAELFYKKVFLKLSQNSQENTYAGVFFLIKFSGWRLKICNFIKTYSSTGVFLWMLCNFLRTPIHTAEHLWTAANVVRNIERPTDPVHKKNWNFPWVNKYATRDVRRRDALWKVLLLSNQSKCSKFLESILIISIRLQEFNFLMLLFNYFKVFWSCLFLSF